MFRAKYPIAWAFHRNTSQWRYQPGSHVHVQLQEAFKEYRSALRLPLPGPGRLKISLGAAIAGRLSCRHFVNRALSLQALATLLHSAYGVQEQAQFGAHEMLTRPVPSGGGLYPLEVYLLVRRVSPLTAGIYHYAPLDHSLERLAPAPPTTGQLTDLFLGQSYAAEAALVVILTAVLDRSLGKYADRGYRLVLLEAGHVGQNLNLAATALRLGSVNMGGFFDQELGAVLELDPELEVPIYAMAVGKPRDADAGTVRRL